MAAPNDKVTYFAETDYRGKRIKFGIKELDRWRHMYVIGKTGMGKSTMLENLAAQDLQNGEGLCFIDPHGSTAETLLSYVPEHRIKDVIYFAPFDQEYPIGFNVMEDIGADKRSLVTSGLIGAFKKVWVDAWSPRMEYLLSNALLALLENKDSTLLGVNRMFADKNYRAMILSNVKDPSVRAFWLDEFAKYSDKFATEATAAIQNKVGQFAANPLIRNMVGQPKSSFDFRKIMDERKILIINLSKGRLGEGNANLIGSMLITKIYLAAMSRADASPEVMKTLPPFYLYVDEFQSFANESFADILSEARKYKLALTIAHQYIEQMSEEVRAAVFGNVGTMMCFRVGAYDAEILEKEFSPQFTIEDIVNLGFAQIYLKLMINGQGSAPFSASTLPPLAPLPRSFVPEIIASSRAQFARPREEVEEDVRKWHEPTPEQPRDPNAPPETKKYTPGTRPPLRTEGSAPQGPGDIGSALRAAGVPPRAPSSAPFSRPPEGESRPFVPRAPSPVVSQAVPLPPPTPPARPMMSVPLRPVAPLQQPAPVPMPPPAPSVPPPIHQPFAQAFAQIQPEPPVAPPAPSPVQINTLPSPRPEMVQAGDRRHTGDRRHEQRYDDRRPSAQPRTPPFDRAPSRPPFSNTRPASLSTLKSGMKKNKGPSEGNLAELKNALQSVLTQPPTQMPTPPPIAPSVPAPRAPDSRFFPPEERERKSEDQPKEVPEDVLRGLLEN